MIELLYIDLFCGAGGTSTGVETARIDGDQFAKVIACVNHDANAIASHAANHPDALHFTEDIRTLDLTGLKSHVEAMRKLYPGARVVLWASLECTNFSIAKGGQSRDADSRTLAEHLFRYIEELNPDYIQIENVKEFMSWGPLMIKEITDKKTGATYWPLDIKTTGTGKKKRVESINPVYIPVPQWKGIFYNHWIAQVKSYGYQFKHKILDAADYGAFTSRKRFFGLFAAGDLPIAFPEPTHTKNPENTLFGPAKEKHKAVREVLDLNDEGQSIFDRKKMHAKATHERVYEGCIKFVAGGKDAFMIKYNSMNGKTGKHIPPDIDAPCPVVAAQARLGIAKVNFIQQRNGGDPASKVISVEGPARTITATGGNQDIVSAKFMAKHYGGHPESKSISIDGPAHTVTAIDHHAIVSADFLSAYYGNGFNATVEGPAPSVTTHDRFQLVKPMFVANYYGAGGQLSDVNKPCPALMTVPKQRLVTCRRFVDQQFGQSKPASIEAPCGSITTKDKYSLVTCNPWMLSTHFDNVGSSIDKPAPTITANRKQHYLMNPQYASKGGSIDKPCFTLIARMDKAPPYLITTDTGGNKLPSFIKAVDGGLVYEIYDTDTEIIKKIKEFMALYGIVDIKMRMLKIPELKRIQGFPSDYKLIGTKEEQKKYIGNAVEVKTARALSCATGLALRQYDKRKAA